MIIITNRQTDVIKQIACETDQQCSGGWIPRNQQWNAMKGGSVTDTLCPQLCMSQSVSPPSGEQGEQSSAGGGIMTGACSLPLALTTAAGADRLKLDATHACVLVEWPAGTKARHDTTSRCDGRWQVTAEQREEQTVWCLCKQRQLEEIWSGRVQGEGWRECWARLVYLRCTLCALTLQCWRRDCHEEGVPPRSQQHWSVYVAAPWPTPIPAVEHTVPLSCQLAY